ncbi:MAG TPA: hypothetical protein DEO56_10225 [Nitrosomonas nitrosa]|uniref:Uncharacterized protein n=1 Tax=Nitrosomonas nitrosa TaxID=52442 RepID=A0A1I4RYG0_9PROT|nr:hypothetical protein [Nitrosomonas nitrosa]MCO6434274.1 hypothetical protein [Nitrosomonas nitrosa]CAE6483386.1 hypothetical protein NMYAN_10068 [Nitrosomonas nitrosa]SFM57336.1 hypothetical protein SAMN05421880_12152 [Nitrosomonas nitrosa]HBZ30950.1 hypothetical protein [Nitrosomonas nitrosa]HNP52296.1 hypothetical protein [Nitrosomonas nitrosa]
MPEKIENLQDFLMAIIGLLKFIDKSSPILFRSNFRLNLSHSLEEAIPTLIRLKEHDYIQFPTDSPAMAEAGLTGSQLDLKLESFEHSYLSFHEEGGLNHLVRVLKKGQIILSSIGKVAPGFGSFAQELIMFIIEELSLDTTQDHPLDI